MFYVILADQQQLVAPIEVRLLDDFKP